MRSITLVLAGMLMNGCGLTGIGQPTCAADSACDDGVFCNGQERCDPGNNAASAFGCVRGLSCADRGGRCSEDTGACVLPRTCQLDCDDGVFCNGQEVCAADFGSCLAGAPPCPEGRCDEAAERCAMVCSVPDADGDGRAAIACGGDDCDDTDPARAPGRTEVCDRDGFDEDCDPGTIGERDADRDGFIDEACFNGDLAGTDCDDGNAGINTGVPEVCNGVDDDCDGQVDEGLSATLYPDDDLDGFGRAGSNPVQACPRAGLSPSRGDCDDANPYLMPGGLQCIPGLQGVEVRVCRGDGTWVMTTCPQGLRCIDQPYGLGICIP